MRDKVDKHEIVSKLIYAFIPFIRYGIFGYVQINYHKGFSDFLTAELKIKEVSTCILFWALKIFLMTW